ncbi:class I SAM-dependent methyltransferase [Oscillatoria sp. FACHB-1407]|uniref:class I SAM-dependent methyltransferase n=1 Tax=Oscillatoria sp. FACHB-1407 TaxID=2692847 RepID=UPI00168A2AE9|nr:class I SAM-dependent methyltransferase [Oscillatoria sp. FACHB-1407]MBD2460391.1 class I SAM-dependent methyltransferase [Oscillatoria sp. FACHB-1407]
MKRIFTHITQNRLWQSAESCSGRGSELACTASIRATLPNVLKKLEVKSILDAPCGDFNWMRHIPLDGIDYTGVDVVPEVIEQNQRTYGSAAIRFMAADIANDALPTADLIICRDCLVHLSLRTGYRALQQFQRSGSKYLLVTTYPRTTKNRDVATGSWRSLNLLLPPFNFGEPLMILSDPSDDTGAHPDKALALWRLDTLDLSKPPALSPQVMLTTFIRENFNPTWQW